GATSSIAEISGLSYARATSATRSWRTSQGPRNPAYRRWTVRSGCGGGGAAGRHWARAGGGRREQWAGEERGRRERSARPALSGVRSRQVAFAVAAVLAVAVPAPVLGGHEVQGGAVCDGHHPGHDAGAVAEGGGAAVDFQDGFLVDVRQFVLRDAGGAFRPVHADLVTGQQCVECERVAGDVLGEQLLVGAARAGRVPRVARCGAPRGGCRPMRRGAVLCVGDWCRHGPSPFPW